MHGTAELFSEFMRMMPEPNQIEVVHYPSNVNLSYDELLGMVQCSVPTSDPYFLLAESFSTPLAIQFAATNPANLKGLILCAGFAASPLGGLKRSLASLLAPIIFHLPISSMAINHFLIGPNASKSLKESVRAAISSVKPKVLSARLHAVLTCDVRSNLSNVKAPKLYIRATRDRLVHWRCLEEIQAILPQVKAVELDGPHLILQREPKQSAEVVARFIEETL
jgi:pimeloyl-ACP methyl ester carboxylesterase